MGVPAFYRWLSEKYPKIVSAVLEKRNEVIEGTAIPLNLLEDNPNGVEYDNLYVDMNGLIHPCSHPEDREAPTSESEMYVNVTKYVDRLFAAVRPRKVLFLAIDGVAPRAKMNQQRSRRFRAVKDAKERQKVMDEVMQDMKDLGLQAPEGHGHEWDSNVITPGTEFMSNLSLYLRFYVLDRMNKNPAWRNIKVILSDASEPGEGEHKIMNFVRAQRAKPGYDPNQRHILHGLDADLIMLALATHEPHFTILRELVSFGGKKESDKPERSEGQKLLDAQSNRNMAAASAVAPHDEWVYGKPLQALNISVLRDYLMNEFKCLQNALPFGFDFERIVDDFVFLCFFVGNDFLPHLPSLDIRDGAIDFLIESYKEMLPSLGNYITSPGGTVNLQQADVILGRVGEVEDEVFRRKKGSEDQEERRRASFTKIPRGSGPGGVILAPKDRAKAEAASMLAMVQQGQVTTPLPPRPTSQYRSDHPQTAAESKIAGETTASAQSVAAGNKEAAMKLKGSILGKRSTTARPTTDDTEVDVKKEANLEIKSEMIDGSEDIKTEIAGAEMEVKEEEMCFEEEVKVEAVPLTPAEALKAKEDIKKRMKAKESEMIDGYKKSLKDTVCLHESGWKSRYYEDPFKKENLSHGGGLKRMCLTYVEGLCWVMKYYYQGVPSWNWYYPFHYAPFASDLINIDSYKIEFELSEPFRPVEQLLAVLPAESVGALPRACRALMVDPSSPIIDLYGSDAPIDPNGKHLPWLWILLLPFVDEKRIVSAFQQYKAGLSVEECRRNAFGVSIVFLHSNHKLAIEARSKMRYRPLKEVDADVLHALSVANEDLGPEDYDDADDSCNTAAASASADDSVNTDTDAASKVEVKVPLEESIVFDPVLGDGISGTLSAPPQKWFALSGPGFTVTAPPTPPPAAFHNLVGNQVICLTFASPPEIPGSHKSELLPGVVLEKSNLTNFDLAARKPPRLNRGGFNIVDLALGIRRGPNTNNILRYEGNGNQRGGDGGGYHPNQQQYNHNNQGSNPQQFLQHFQQQQQQYGNNNGNQGYGYDIGNRGYNGRGGRQDGNDGRNGQQSGGNGWNRNNNNNDNGRQYNQNQNQNQNQQQYRHQQPMNDNRSYNQHQQPYQHQQQHQQHQQQHQQHGGQNYSHQQYPPQSQGYQQQQQYSGNFLTAQAYPSPSAPKSNPRFSFSSQGPSGPGPNGSSGSITAISMDSMRAQLAMTLQQQGGQGPQGQGPGPGPGSFSSIGRQDQQGQQGDKDRR